MRKENTIFTSSASVSEQKEHLMLSSSPSLIPHLLKKKTLQAGGPRRYLGGVEVGGALTSAGFSHNCKDSRHRRMGNRSTRWAVAEGGWRR